MPASRRLLTVLLVLIGASLLLPQAGLAQDDRHAVLEGQFVRHREVRVGDNEFLAIVVQVPERGQATVVVPRRNEELMQKARALKEGDRVRIEAVREADQWWVQALRNDGRPDREGDRPREGDAPREGDRPREADRERREGDVPREIDRPDARPEGDREQDRPRETDRPAADQAGVIEGWHATFTETKIGDRSYTGLMIRIENGDWLLVVVPRENERLQTQARNLSRNDAVRIEYVRDGGRRWLKALRVAE